MTPTSTSSPETTQRLNPFCSAAGVPREPIRTKRTARDPLTRCDQNVRRNSRLGRAVSVLLRGPSSAYRDILRLRFTPGQQLTVGEGNPATGGERFLFALAAELPPAGDLICLPARS